MIRWGGASTKRQSMGINLNTKPSVPFRVPVAKTLLGYRMAPSDEAEDGGPRKASPSERSLAGGDDLPYRVELWDEEKKAVEQILAVTANATIGYAAYYAATGTPAALCGSAAQKEHRLAMERARALGRRGRRFPPAPARQR